MDADKNFLVGVFDDEDVLLRAASQKVRDNGVKIHEVFSPFPVHGLMKRLGCQTLSVFRSAAFLFGLTGTCTCA